MPFDVRSTPKSWNTGPVPHDRFDERSVVIEYQQASEERIFAVVLTGKSGNLLWGLCNGRILTFERRWITRMVSVETLQNVGWDEIPR